MLKELVNRCITQTLTRSIYTSLTTFITIAVLYVMGVSSIKEFALPLMVGIVCGAYSSVCITGALWYTMKTKGAKLTAMNAVTDNGAAGTEKSEAAVKEDVKGGAVPGAKAKNGAGRKAESAASAGKTRGKGQAHSVRRYSKNRTQKD